MTWSDRNTRVFSKLSNTDEVVHSRSASNHRLVELDLFHLVDPLLFEA